MEIDEIGSVFEELLPVRSVETQNTTPDVISNEKTFEKVCFPTQLPCYLCNNDCVHHCMTCKTPCHGPIIGCSRAVEGEEGKFVCMQCSDESFVHKSASVSIEQTTTSHEGQKIKKKSPNCPQCGKAFAQNSNLKRHLYKIHGVKEV